MCKTEKRLTVIVYIMHEEKDKESERKSRIGTYETSPLIVLKVSLMSMEMRGCVKKAKRQSLKSKSCS